ncbi:Vancomycin resistance protein YoaR, contains peptidoglycan-binding and VanW domains [Lentibacillus halodurans]|uniref:Vancomycin resistance protein YoaR, contains peptidoglycan-binding and VanW domains n=1 Tax=Lentibacillus halodurans TaxID=237679 RepID=A0A1I0WB94_9BACI|nr:VanW family protein [Lentibacillus halodurans]SFA85637.1 Vancomycin resistance protein YoaR, contains peptidoglycan-binding and VanW domains [Lentibacillus halodurans]
MMTVFLSFLLASAPLTVTEDDHAIDKLVKEDFELLYVDGLLIDETKLELQMDILDQKIYQEPINAKLDGSGKIIQEKPGTTLDRMKFRKLFQDYFYEGKPNKIALPERKTYPRVDSELLAEIREHEINRYVTHFKPRNKERSRNIELAAESINNHVVFPGERFSFNDVVGERTEEKGYKRAPVIVKGELAEDIGGGICQVSSTLYNAVDLKGIEITERYSHSRNVPYVPPGRDATVSWYGPDFVFTNKYKHPILIRASAHNGNMQIQILSSESP